MLNINELNTAKKEIKSKKDKEKLEPVIDLSIDAWSDFRDDDEGEVVTQSGFTVKSRIEAHGIFF